MDNNNTAIIIAVVTSIITIVALVIVARFIWKRPWILFVSAAVCGATAYLTQQPAWWGVTVVAAVLGALAVKPKPAKGVPQKTAAKDAPNEPRYKSLADFAATVAADPKAIDSNLHAIFTDLRNDIAAVYHDSEDARERAILAVPLASLDIIASAKIADKSKPMFTSVGALAFAIEDKVVRLDAAIRRILTEIYDYCEVCSDNEDMTSIAYDLELALWPHEQSQAQAEAASKRQAKIEARIDAQLKAQNGSTPA